MGEKKTPVIIDCDTGIDDALALTLALASDALDVRAITTVAGNVRCEYTTKNTCNVVHLLGRDEIPVGKGADKPLERDLMCASGVHGVTGLRGYSFAKDYTKNLVSEPAWELLRDVLMGSDEQVTLIAIGPVTNIALLLRFHPEVKPKIKEIVFMGTSYHCGNPTPLATFNVLVDPEAFRQVLFSGIPFVACPLDVTRTAIIGADECKMIRRLDSRVSQFVMSIIDNYGLSALKPEELENLDVTHEEELSTTRIRKSQDDGVTMHDPATVAYVISPELFTVNRYYCDVECKGELTTGFTLIDKANYYHDEKPRNLTLIESIDRKAFVSLFLDAVKRYPR